MDSESIKLSVDPFGTFIDSKSVEHEVKRYTWSAGGGIQLQVITYGATITSLKVPDASGHVTDVVMGFDDMSGYRNPSNPYFGSTVGRYANRIKGAAFRLLDKRHQLSVNTDDGNHLHGGTEGFDKVNWSPYISGNGVVLSYLSENGEEGYPGAVLAQITYRVTVNAVMIHMSCKCTETTPVNLTNHSYFNLAGHGSGRDEMLSHEISINADSYTPLDSALTTTGEIADLNRLGITHDMTKPTRLSDFMKGEGFDVNFCIKNADGNLRPISKVIHPGSGRTMEVYSNQPGVQLYTSNFLPLPNETDVGKKLIGKGCVEYHRQGAFCLEPQCFPNAVNQPNFPNSILYPDGEYVHDIVFKFSNAK